MENRNAIDAALDEFVQQAATLDLPTPIVLPPQPQAIAPIPVPRRTVPMQVSGLTEQWWVDEDGIETEAPPAQMLPYDATESILAHADRRFTPRTFVVSMIASAALSALLVALLVKPNTPAVSAAVVATPPVSVTLPSRAAPQPAPQPPKTAAVAPAPAPAPQRAVRPAPAPIVEALAPAPAPAHARKKAAHATRSFKVAKHKSGSWAAGFAD